MSLQTDLFEADTPGRIELDMPDARVSYDAHYLQETQAEQLLLSLYQQLPFQQREVIVYNQHHLTPRLVAFCGDPHVHYRYSGDRLDALPWPEPLQDLRQRIEQDYQCQFNCALLNYYRDGDDCMGWHSDDERELGPEPVIASVSLGAERTFQFKHRNKPLPRIDLKLASGSLLMMQGKTQQYWQHALPKRRTNREPRLNITFRYLYDH